MECEPPGQVDTSLCGPSGVVLSNLKYLASQEVILLLHVSDMSSKEAKRTFLTAVGASADPPPLLGKFPKFYRCFRGKGPFRNRKCK